jgi:hypothetical protein
MKGHFYRHYSSTAPFVQLNLLESYAKETR